MFGIVARTHFRGFTGPVDSGWRWNPSLFAGSAAHYVQGRVPYPRELADALVAELALDGRGRLLDLGCGPGSLTLLLAPWFERATGLDADADMLTEAARQARVAGLAHIDWIHLRAEELPSDLGPFQVATLAQSFHWMDRPLVARRLRELLADDGALVHVHATTHEGIEGGPPLPHPRPPRRAIDDLVERFLGSRRRAGKGSRPDVVGHAPLGELEAEIYRAAGFGGPTRLVVPGTIVDRTTDDVVAGVFSLSRATPHLFGDAAPAFETALRELLAEAAPEGLFSEQMADTVADVWRT
jgi:SAM-dependent methyltransferase